MTNEQLAARYIGKCVVDGADEIKKMLGIDKPAQHLGPRSGGAARAADTIRFPTTPRRLLNV